MGSHIEGWPTSMVEALACGKNIISTNVSGAKDMIYEKKNGFIVFERDPILYAKAMENGLELNNPNTFSLQKAKQYASSNLNFDFNNFLLIK